jgi:hypothetical protein
MRGIGNFIFGLVILVLLLGAVIWFWALPQVDVKLADAVRREYLLPPSATVEINRGSLLDTLEGQVESFYVESEEAKIDDVTVSDLKFVAEGIEFDLPQTLLTQRAELKNLDHGRLSFRIREEALVERWAADLEAAGLKKVEVKLTDNDATVSGLLDLALVKMRIGGKGKLGTDGNAIRFELEELTVGDNKIGLAEMNAVFSKLAPVLDIGQFKKVGIHIDKLDTGNGFIEIEATSRDLDLLEQEIKDAKRKRELEEQSDDGPAKEDGADGGTEAAESDSAEDGAATGTGGGIDPGTGTGSGAQGE